MTGPESEPRKVQFPIVERNLEYRPNDKVAPPKVAESVPSAGVDISEFLVNSRVLMENAEWTMAFELLQAALEKSPNDLRVIQSLGVCYQNLDQMSLARDCFATVMESAPTPEVLFHFAVTSYHVGEFEESENSFLDLMEKMSHLEPKQVFEVYKTLGNINVRRADYESAEEYYNKAYRISPNSDALHVNFGTLCIQMNDHNGAKLRFRQAVELNSSNDKAWLGLALVHRHFGDVELSWGNIERALDLNPKNKTAIFLASEWAFKDGKERQIVDYLRAYQLLNPQDPEVSLILCEALITIEQVGAAERELARLNQLAPNSQRVKELMQSVDERKLRRKEFQFD